MLRSLKDLESYAAIASDGEIGTAVNCLFDDEHWTVRYIILSTNDHFDGRHVLVSPSSFREIDWTLKRLSLALTKAKIENSPNVNTDRPVSRLHEREYYRHYGYAPYWGGSGLWGEGSHPELLATEKWRETPPDAAAKSGDIHLRSASKVREYSLQGTDAAVGRVDDFIFDDRTWEIRYFVLNASSWWSGKKTLVAPSWVTRINWASAKINTELTRDAIRSSPEWDPPTGVHREYEARLHDHYGRPGYWLDGE